MPDIEHESLAASVFAVSSTVAGVRVSLANLLMVGCIQQLLARVLVWLPCPFRSLWTLVLVSDATEPPLMFHS
jgi:hypothetical protein